MGCVILGGGVAGFQAAFACRKYWPDKSITLVDAENEIGYYRTLLPQFMMGTITEEKLFFWRPEDDSKLTVHAGVKVISLDRDKQQLRSDDGKVIEYERLILACGGRAIIPPVCPDNTCGGVFPVRYLTAARDIKKWLPSHPSVVVLGGGLVGVKTAAHLAHSGFKVTIVEQEEHLLPQALSSNAAALVKQHLEEIGIRIYLGSSVDDIQVAQGKLKAIQTGGRWLSCETLLIATGSTPDVEFLSESGLLEDNILSVSPDLRTKDGNVFAVGDAVTITNKDAYTPWTWPQAVNQGKLAAANLYDPIPAPLKVLSRVNAMNLFGLSLTVLGAPVRDAEVIRYDNPHDRVYREIYVKNEQIVGGALVGDISGAGMLHALMISGGKVGKDDSDLLTPHGKAFPQRSWYDLNQYRSAVIIS